MHTSRSRREPPVSPLRLAFTWFLAIHFILIQTPVALYAPPEGQQVVQGTVDFSQNGSTTTITASDRAIIQYTGFDILGHETVIFVQPSELARVLNRVDSPDPTQILGSIQANGIVYLVNPAGIYFGQNAFLDVGGLFAAAGNISNENFLANLNQFSGLQGSVTNAGTIEAGSTVSLLGANVINHGTIVSRGDEVALLAGNEVYLGEAGGHVFVNLGSATQAGTGVENTGTISAQGGAVTLAAGDIYSLAIRQHGDIYAPRVTVDAGAGRAEVGGRVDASSASGVGGEIAILGEQVHLTGGASLDASGATGGGTIRVGGDFHGANPEVRNAETTLVEAGATLKADAMTSGDGGDIVVWANGATGYGGSLSARGGVESGNGGFAEVSGKDYLVFRGRADVGAPAGAAGTILLDPRDLTISAAGADDASLVGSTFLVDNPDRDTDATLTNTIVEALTGNVILQADRDLFIDAGAALNFSNVATTSVLFEAGRSIEVQDTVSSDGATLTFTADSAGGNQGTGAPYGGTPTISIFSNVGDANTGAIAFNNATGAGGVSFGPGVSVTSAGAVTIDSSATLLVLPDVTAASLSATAGGGITDPTGTTLAVTGLVTLNAGGGAITVGDDVTDTINFGSVNLTGGAVAVSEDSATTLAGVSASSLTVNSAGAITDGTDATIAVTGLATFDAGANAITLGNQAGDTINLGSVNLTGTDVVLAEDSATQLAGVSASSLTVNSAGAITDGTDATIAVTGLATFNAGANAITLGNEAGDTINLGSVNLTGTNVSLTEDSATTLTGVDAATFSLTSAGDITDADGTTIAVAGQATLNAGANAITVGDNAGDTTNFGSLNLTGGAVTVTEDSATQLAGVSATTLSLTSAGAITDTAASSVAVTGLATLNAGINAITLGNDDTTNFGSLNLTGGAVSVIEDSATTIAGATTTGDLNISSAGALNLTGAADSGANTVRLVSAGGMSQSVAGTITAGSLSARNTGSGSIVLAGSNQVGTVAANNAVNAAAVNIVSDAAGGLAIGSVSASGTFAATTGVTTADGDITLTAGGGNLLVNQDVESVGGGNGSEVIGTGVIVAPGVTVDASGGTTIALTGVGLDTILGGNVTVGSATISANRDVIISGTVNSTAVGGLTITADSDNNGAGGVLVTGTGTLTAGGLTSDLSIAGSSVVNSGNVGGVGLGVGRILFIDAGGSISTVQNVNVSARPAAPAGASIEIRGNGTTPAILTSSGSITLAPEATGGSTILNGGSLANPLLSGTGTVSFGGRPVTLSGDTRIAAADTTFAGAVEGPGGLSVSNNASFASTVGGGSALGSLAVGGATTLTGGAVTTSGAQTYTGAVTLNAAANSTTLAGTDIAFGSTVRSATDGEETLVVTGSGTTTFGGAVGDNSQSLAALTSNGGGTTAINGGSVTTTGAQTYGDAITLGADATLASTAAADLTFSSTIDGARALVLNTGGGTVLSGAVGATTPLTSLTTDATGTTSIGGSAVRTSGAQVYNDLVTQTAGTTISAGSLTVGGVAWNAGSNDLTLNIATAITLPGVFSGVNNFASTGAGGTTFTADFTTLGSQTYGNAVTIAGTTYLYSTGNGTMTFNSTIDSSVDGTFDFVVGSSGLTTFNGALGGTARFARFATFQGGTTVFNAGVSALSDIVLLDANEIGADMTFTSTNGPVSIGGTLDSVAGQANDVTIAAGTGVVTFSSAVGGAVNGELGALTVTTSGSTNVNSTVRAASLTANGGGTTAINGGTITTSGAQTYADDVTLGAATTLASTGGGAIDFGATVDGAQDLTLNTSGTTTLGGAVGGVTALTSLTTDAGGTTAIEGGAVITTADQTYGDAVLLDSATDSTTLTGAAITLGSTVRSSIDGQETLVVSGSGITTFNGAVGDNGQRLSALTTDGGGLTVLNGGSVNTSGIQTYNDDVVQTTDMTLVADSLVVGGAAWDAGSNDLTLTIGSNVNVPLGTVTNLDSFTSNGAGGTTITGDFTTLGSQTYGNAVTLAGAGTNITLSGTALTFGSTVDGARGLTLDSAGATTLGGAVGGTIALSSLTTNVGGTTAINTTTVSTTGAQTYGDAVTLGADAVLASSGGGALTFGSTVNGAQALTLNTTGATTLGGSVGGTIALTSLTTSAGGTTAINGGAVATTGAQIYGDNLTLGADTSLDTANGAVSVVGSLNSANATPRSLAINAGTGAISLGSAGTANALGTVTLNSTGTTTLGGPLSATSLATNAGGSTVIGGGAVTTTGAQAFGDAVALDADTVLTASTGGVGFAGTVDSQAGEGNDLTVNAGTANITFSGAVGSATDGALGVLSVNTFGTTTLDGSVLAAGFGTSAGGTVALNGGSVTTSGAQVYNGPVILGSDATLTSSSGGLISLGGPVDGAFALAVNTAGETRLVSVGASTALASLATDAPGTTTINGPVTTVGAQTLGDAITLGADVVLTGGSLSLGSTVDGAQALTLNSAGATTLAGAVGGTTALTSLTTDAAGTTTIGGGAVTTTGAQAYNDAVALGAGTTLAGGSLTLASTVDGAQVLTLNSAGATTLGGAIGGTTALTSLTTDAGGTTTINGGAVTTTGAQTYNDAATLGANTTVATANGAVVFGGTLDSADATARDLTVNAGSGAIMLGATGGTNALGALALDSTGGTTLAGAVTAASVTTNAGGTTAFNGGSVTTTGAQNYNDAVTLGAATTLASSGGGALTFVSTIDGGQTLALTTTGATTLGGAVGGSTALTSLTTDVGGTTALNGGSVTTTGAQTYGDALTLGADTTLAGGSLALASTVNGAQALTLNSAGATTLGGAVGGTTALTSLTTDAGGTTAINGGGVTTTGAQTYGDAITLGADATLAGSSLTLGSTVNGAQALALNSAGATTLGGAVGGTTALTSLTTDAGGTTAINGGGVTTTGAQNYNDAVTLGAATTLAGGSLTLGSTVNGAQALTLNSAGATTLGGAVGGTTALASLSTDAAGSTAINGGGVTTTGAQNYGDAVTLGADTTLSGGSIAFGSTVNGARTLTLNSAGTTTLGGAVGGTTALTSLTTDAAGTTAINGGGVTTTGAQTFSDAVTLGAATTLAGGSLTLGSTVDGAQTLALNSAGTTALGGAVGGTTALTGLMTDAGGTTTINGNVTTIGAQTYNDAVRADADIAIATTNGAVTFAAAVDSEGAEANDLTVTSGTGDVVFSAATGAGGALGALTANSTGTTTFGGAIQAASLTTNAGGTTAINGGAVTTTGAQAYNDAVTLGAATTLASGAGNLTLASTVTGAHALTLNSTGTTTLGGAVTVTSVSTDAGGTTAVNGGSVTTTGVQTYNDAVTFGAATTFASGAADLTFASTVTGTQGLTLNSTGTTSLGGAVSAGTITTNAGGITTLNGNVSATGAINFDDDVRIDGDLQMAATNNPVRFAGTVNSQGTEANDLTVTAGTGNVEFVGDVGAASALGLLDVTAQNIGVRNVTTSQAGGASGNQVYRASDVLLLGGTGNATYATGGGSVTINSGRTALEDSISVWKSSTGDLRFELGGGSLDMAQFERLVVSQGHLIIAGGDTVSLADSIAGRGMDITADTLVLRGERYLAPTVTLTTGDLRAEPRPGAGNQEVFTVIIGTYSGEIDGDLITGVTPALIDPTRIIGNEIDPSAEGLRAGDRTLTEAAAENIPFPDIDTIPRADIAQLLAGSVPTQGVEVVQETNISPALREQMVLLGIYARPASEQELRAKKSSQAVYTQLIADDSASADQFEVVETRLSATAVERAIDTYHGIFSVSGAGGARASRVPELQRTLNDAFRRYVESVPNAEPAGFYAHLQKNTQDEVNHRALQVLVGMSTLFHEIESLGLTDKELDISKSVLLRPLRVSGLSSSALRQNIEQVQPTVATSPGSASDAAG